MLKTNSPAETPLAPLAPRTAPPPVEFAQPAPVPPAFPQGQLAPEPSPKHWGAYAPSSRKAKTVLIRGPSGSESRLPARIASPSIDMPVPKKSYGSRSSGTTMAASIQPAAPSWNT